MNDLVSIVLIVGNIESYINVCMQNILNQSYKKIELIIVNKGSKDNTMKICEYYEKTDKRIKIINVDARTSKNPKNVGLENSKGKYIAIIDGGDLITSDYIAYMHDVIVKEDADIVCVNAKENSIKRSATKGYDIYRNNDILKQFLHMNLDSRFYGKLYKKEIFNDVEYKENEYFDDSATTYKLYAKAKKVVNSSLTKYCIIERKNNSRIKITDKDRIKKMDACFDLLNYIEIKHPKLLDYCKTKLCYEAIDIFRNIKDKDYQKQMYNYIRIYRKYALKDKRFNFKKKILCIRSILGYRVMKISFMLEKSV